MVYTGESPDAFFAARICDCDEPGSPVFRGPGFVDLCSTCDKWLRRQLRRCLQCNALFMYIYQHPNQNFNTCWECVQDFNKGYNHRPLLKIIPPEDACVPVHWSKYVSPVHDDLPPLPLPD